MKKLITLFAIGLMMSCSVDDELMQPEDQNMVVADVSINCEGFTAGKDSSAEIEVEAAEALPSYDEVRKVYLAMLDKGVPTNGTFSPNMKQIVTDFNTGSKIGSYPTTYTVKSNDGCMDSANLTLMVVAELSNDPVCTISAGADVKFEMEVSKVDAIPSIDEARKLFLNRVEKGVLRTGTFNPTIKSIVEQYNRGDKLGEYSTTYTVAEGDCKDSAVITLVVVEDIVICDLDAGADASFTLTKSEAESIPSEDELRKLYMMAAEQGIPTNGTFSPSLEQIVKNFNSGDKIGSYSTVYTINDGECSDSVQLTLIVEADPIETDPEVCSISAGSDNMKTITLSEAKALPSIDEVKKVYLRMLDSGVSRTGTFSPSIKTVVSQFNSNSGGVGEYTVTYTVSNGECSDSTQLTLKVVEN